ncbi:adhesion G-protein coupled receptor G5-like isoform X2 [Gouania willdenowi]|uniref:adhesion G-protein coupled receptor G5-like isoform X2 n=1 Tax=Gouania willdenowi TaxID=441366 RepID=UPI0010543666|nr:adhesion G-protein coupled receptor G5-like isoform X2 [Gouania willdenowi]
MEQQLAKSLSVVILLVVHFSAGFSENDLYFNFCGTWCHGKTALNLNINLSTGCDGISISANRSTLFIDGAITAQCRMTEVIPLNQFGVDLEVDTHFCLYWEPLLDQLKLQIGGRNLILCQPATLRDSCCTDLSHGSNTPEAKYGIKDGRIGDDLVTNKILTAYNFEGHHANCKTLYDQGSGSLNGSTLKEMEKLQKVAPCCPQKLELELKEDYKGSNITSNVSSGEHTVSVYLPSALKQAAKTTNKVICTFLKDNSVFQEVDKEAKILSDVVEIIVGNEVITDLPEPIRISFNHDIIPKTHSRRCVSWDTRKDPWLVNWIVDGCKTRQKGEKHTECLCDHLTYFTVLVELETQPVRHLLELTVITSLGCVVSAISCVALIIYLCRKSHRSKGQCNPIHLGLAVSLAFLNLLFFFTGVLANVGGESVCIWVGAILHYALLSSFAWMGIEVFHTFWLVYMVFSPSPKPYVWNVLGFVLPAVPVIILVAVGDVYGLREVMQAEDLHSPYQMCGTVMLLLVYREIRNREEWKQNGVAFLSIWGLSCLFGTAWSLTFLTFGPFIDFIRFIACILTSFQGFLLMLRFCLLDWKRNQAGGSALGSSSTGSTRQHMLQSQEKS